MSLVLPKSVRIQPAEVGETSGGGFLISPAVDIFMIGGASLGLLLLSHYAIGTLVVTSALSSTLSYFVNFPHFMASYQLLYWDQKKRLLREAPIFFAAFIVPAVLLAVFVYSIYFIKFVSFVYLVEAMFFLVGWHYAKQVYGTVLITSQLKGFSLSFSEKMVLKWNLLSLWFLPWAVAQDGRKSEFLGIHYQTFTVHSSFVAVAYCWCFVSALAVVGLGVRKYIVEGRTPPLVSLVSYLSIYAWSIPAFMQPTFFGLIPFFHSFQYLLFVVALRKNKAHLENQNLKGPEYRSKFLMGFLGYLTLSVVLGYFLFDGVPNFLDTHFKRNTMVLGSSIYLCSFYLFINIHHYFIDSVIWTRTNPDLFRFLIQPNRKSEGRN